MKASRATVWARRLLAISTALILTSVGLELRVVALALIAVAVAATAYVHYLARRRP